MFDSPLDDWQGQINARVREWLAPKRSLHGLQVWVINTRKEIDTPNLFQRVNAVLNLIAQYQPARYQQLKEDLSRIIVKRYPSRAAYDPSTHTCLLELSFVASPTFTDAEIAASLIHEAVHAALQRSGEIVTDARAERLCRMAELEFGQSLPDGDRVVARARESLALNDCDIAPVVDWHEAFRRLNAMDADSDSSSGNADA